MDEVLRESDQHLPRTADPRRLEEWVRAQYEELGPGLRRYLARLTSDSALADDLCQETFLRLFEQRLRRRQVQHIRPWLYKVAHNLAIDHLRDLGHGEWRQNEEALEREESTAPSAEAQILMAERHRQVRRGLSMLSANERQALELRAEGMRYREIAETMGLEVSTVATFLSRAVRKIGRQVNG